MNVRKSSVAQGKEAAGFIDAADFEKLKQRGDPAVRRWIDAQLQNTSVTVVLVGSTTCSSRFVKYEIEQSIARGNGLLGIDISRIRDFSQRTTTCCGEIPKGYPFYRWNRDQGRTNLGAWIEAAAKAAGK